MEQNQNDLQVILPPENPQTTPQPQTMREFILSNGNTAAPPKKKYELLPHDSIFAWLSVAAGFLIVRFAIVCREGFVTTALFLLLLLGCAVYVRKCGCRPQLPQRILGVLLAAFSVVFSISANTLLHGLCSLFLLAGLIWYVTSVCGKTGFVTRFFLGDLTQAALPEPFDNFGAALQAISASVKKSSTATAVKTVLIGLLVTLPLTGIVAALLASADSGVSDMLSKLGSLLTDNVMSTIVQIACGIPVGFWFFGMLYSGAKRRENPLKSDAEHEESLRGLRVVPNLGLYAGVTPICLLYLCYVISQTNYFLSAFAGKLPADMIYSEYARRGFFELCAIAVINLIVILVLTGCAKKGGEERTPALTGYALVLCLFTLFIIATAIAKMVLYIDAYGLTSLRLNTAWFMVLLAIVFIVLALRLFVKKLPTAMVLTVSFIGMFGLLCFSRPDALIAEYNIRRYEQGTLPQLDAEMLCDLSEDAYTVMLDHIGTLRAAGKEDVLLRRLHAKSEHYSLTPEDAWNLPAQVLLHSEYTK